MAKCLSEEREVELIDMFQARPVLYEVISKEHYNRNKRMVVVHACNMWLCLYDLPFCISPVFVAAGVADAATRIFQFILFLNMRLRLIIILLLSVTI